MLAGLDDAAADDVSAFGKGYAWINLQMKLPSWLTSSSDEDRRGRVVELGDALVAAGFEDDRAGGGQEAAPDAEDLTGTSAIYFAAEQMFDSETAFKRGFFWCIVVTVTVVALHVPACALAHVRLWRHGFLPNLLLLLPLPLLAGLVVVG